MTATEPLPARLVATADKIHAGIVVFGRHTEGLLREAAARIELLEADVDRLLDRVEELAEP